MYEVELKVRADHDTVRDRLTALDVGHVETVTQEDTYYDAPDRSFADTDEALRVRIETTAGECRTFLTYKGPLVDDNSKTRTEAETRVTDEAATRALLSGLGYEPAATVRKERERYTFEGCTVTLDSVDGLGEFVEVEYAGESASETETSEEGVADAGGEGVAEADIDRAREHAVAVLEQLELDVDEQIRTSYLGLLLAEEEETDVDD